MKLKLRLEFKGTKMSRRCELTGKGVLTGNNVSHANNKTRRRFLPNLCNVSLLSDALGKKISLKVSAQALRTVEYKGGLDEFLLKAKDNVLSDRALKVKQLIKQAKSESTAPAQASAA